MKAEEHAPTVHTLTEEIDKAAAVLANFVDGEPYISTANILKVQRLATNLKSRVQDLEDRLEDLMWEMGG